MEDAEGRRPEEIHEWIDSYARRGWPDTTPGYAVREYPDLLAASGDAALLSALARDPDRHAFLLRVTGSDYAAEAEIVAAQRLVAAQDEPDLQALLELAVYRNAMALRNQCLPFALPGVWARLGRFDHGEALARAIPTPMPGQRPSRTWRPRPRGRRPRTVPKRWPGPSPIRCTRCGR